jgi:hypothetical protein
MFSLAFRPRSNVEPSQNAGVEAGMVPSWQLLIETFCRDVAAGRKLSPHDTSHLCAAAPSSVIRPAITAGVDHATMIL